MRNMRNMRIMCQNVSLDGPRLREPHLRWHLLEGKLLLCGFHSSNYRILHQPDDCFFLCHQIFYSMVHSITFIAFQRWHTLEVSCRFEAFAADEVLGTWIRWRGIILVITTVPVHCIFYSCAGCISWDWSFPLHLKQANLLISPDE